MLALMAWAINNGMSKNEKQYLETIGFSRTNISNLRKGLNRFTVDQIEAACRHTGANANWILGLESQMMRHPGKNPIEQIKEAIVALEAGLQAPQPGNKKINKPQTKAAKNSSSKK